MISIVAGPEPPVQPSGNRCGHSPSTPRWFTPPAQHKPRPRILERLTERIRAYYHDPMKVLPSLNLANGSERQQRSERREGCLQLLGGLIHYLDLVTLRVGIPCDDGSFRGLVLPELAALSGLHERRAERACHDLVAAGIVTVHPIAKQNEAGVYSGLPSVRTISQALFKAFGMTHWLRHEREKASKRRCREARDEAALGRIELVLKAAAVKRRPGAEASAPDPVKPLASQDPRLAIARIKAFLSHHGPP